MVGCLEIINQNVHGFDWIEEKGPHWRTIEFPEINNYLLFSPAKELFSAHHAHAALVDSYIGKLGHTRLLGVSVIDISPLHVYIL